jgi:hypothetical protein
MIPMGHHFKLVGSETVDLTPDLAADFSKMSASTSERDLKPSRMDYLKDAVLSGTAISFSWARAKIASTGEIYRVNGHHSSTMLAALNGQFPEGLKVHIDDYEVNDKLSLGLLFRQFDSRLSSRSIDDISGAYQGLQPDLVGIRKKIGRQALEGAIWYKKNIVGNPVPTGDDRFDLFDDQSLHPFIQMVEGVCSIKTPEFSPPVMGAMYGTWDREPKWAEQFWIDVAKQGGDNPTNHPSATLDAWLVDALQRKTDKPKQTEVYRACAIAWNAHRHGRTLDRITKFDPKKGAPDIE